VRIAITASTGLIGSALVRSLEGDGIDVLRLVRRPPQGAGEVRWDPTAADAGLDPAALDGTDAVVHLSGAPLAQGRWTAARKQELRASRIDSTQNLVRAMLAAANRPPVLLAGSAVGWYGDTGSREVDESAPAGTGFLADLVRDWEAAAQPAADAGIRVVHLRSGVVLSRAGGMLKPLLLPFRVGLGVRFGPGTQYLSWIGIEDHVGASRFLLDKQQLSGPVNLTAPHPVTNGEFTTALAAQVHRPALLRLPSGALRAALGEVSGELLGSCRVRPARLEEAGFAFRQPHIGQALAAALQVPDVR
jgi:uncharacterized protein (TIGR01777 family)